MSKKISEYTLGEIKELCHSRANSHGDFCIRCPVDHWCAEYLTDIHPEFWDLSDSLRFDEEDRRFAYALQRTIPRACCIYRADSFLLGLIGAEGQWLTDLNRHLFSSINIGEKVSLEKILSKDVSNNLVH